MLMRAEGSQCISTGAARDLALPILVFAESPNSAQKQKCVHGVLGENQLTFKIIVDQAKRMRVYANLVPNCNYIVVAPRSKAILTRMVRGSLPSWDLPGATFLVKNICLDTNCQVKRRKLDMPHFMKLGEVFRKQAFQLYRVAKSDYFNTPRKFANHSKYDCAWHVCCWVLYFNITQRLYVLSLNAKSLAIIVRTLM